MVIETAQFGMSLVAQSILKQQRAVMSVTASTDGVLQPPVAMTRIENPADTDSRSINHSIQIKLLGL